MKVERRQISELKTDPKNARKHNAKNLKAIKGSLEKFGQQKPIIVTKENVIIAGNGTYAAAKELGWTQIDVVVSTLDAVNQKAFALADNRTAELAEWDDDFLSESLQALSALQFDLGNIGFDEMFVKKNTPSKSDQKDDVVPDVPKNVHNVKRGQVWQLGAHRLMCGDSTNEADVAKLMDGKKADMVFTDPPYNVALGFDETPEQAKSRGRRTDGLVVQNDKFENRSDFQEFLLKVFKNCLEFMKPGAAIYVAHSPSEQKSFAVSFEDAGFKLRQVCVWVKSALVMGRQDYQWKHEPILYGWKDGASHFWNSDRTQTTVWEFDKPSTNALHPTMKPVELVAYAVGNSSAAGQLVFDAFAGSGTTLIACEKEKRVCNTMELDEHYCSVIIERWQQFTGKKAELINRE